MVVLSYEAVPSQREPSESLVTDSTSCLFLDIDGTLLEIAPAPELVVVPPELREMLSRLSDRLGGALALVSGRSIDQIDRLFAPLQLPTAGEHGAELRRGPGESVIAAPPPSMLAQIAARLTEATKGLAGVRLERKRAGVVVHFRQAPEQEGRLRGFVDAAVADHVADIQVMPGKMVLEVRERAYGKDQAVIALMQRPPFVGRRPIFLGDDVADREGFAAARRFGGCGIAVGPDHADAADWCFASPTTARAWLNRLAGGAGPRA